MSAPAVIGFAGVLVAAVATGLLAGRAVRDPGIGRIAWVAAGLALTVALAAESIGFDRGFGSATFRAVQLSGLLLAPLWLAWGLAELTWPAEAARFGARLACAALTVVGGVILVTDPLALVPFGKDWPPAGLHYQPPSLYALNAVQAVAVIFAVASVGLIAGPGRVPGRRRPGALPGAAAAAGAVLLLAAMRFSLPSRLAYPLLGLAAAVLTWLGASRLAGGLDQAAAGEPMTARPGGHGRDDRPGPDQSRGQGVLASLPDPVGGAAPHRGPAGPWAQANREWPEPRGGRRAADGDWSGVDGNWPEVDAPRTGLSGSLGAGEWSGSPGAGWPVPPPGPAGLPGLAGAASAGSGPSGPPPGPAARPYGRILIFTLLEDRVAEFDRLAEQLAEEILAEPDTLVFVIHLVPNAPLQRIFYEVYRDRTAFDRHEREPYVTRFAADRRPCVLATNVIELRLKYAKVAPLPAAPQSAPQAPARQAPAPQAQVLEPLPPRPDPGAGYAQHRYGGR